ncbi:MAG: PIG-L family deacetylase [Acidimicrobiales bacterium]|nr:PIG-L family deacetylase [Acidimicrobiales bacterium]
MADGPAPANRPTTDRAVPERVLAIGAHPDDIEFGCGATLSKWAADGCEVSLLVCTDGSKGTWDPHADLAELVVTRQAEQRVAAKRLGATGEVVFCDWVDGELESGLRQRAVVASWIRRLRPNVVLGHDPWKRYRLHPDHRHAGLLAVEGVVAARDPHFFTEQALPHHRPDALLLFEADEANHVEVLTEAQIDTKIAALEAHESQFVSTMGIRDGDDESRTAFARRIRDEAAEHGALAGVALGEAFHAIIDL